MRLWRTTKHENRVQRFRSRLATNWK